LKPSPSLLLLGFAGAFWRSELGLAINFPFPEGY
jgi:hypothetical protein